MGGGLQSLFEEIDDDVCIVMARDPASAAAPAAAARLHGAVSPLGARAPVQGPRGRPTPLQQRVAVITLDDDGDVVRDSAGLSGASRRGPEGRSDAPPDSSTSSFSGSRSQASDSSSVDDGHDVVVNSAAAIAALCRAGVRCAAAAATPAGTAGTPASRGAAPPPGPGRATTPAASSAHDGAGVGSVAAARTAPSQVLCPPGRGVPVGSGLRGRLPPGHTGGKQPQGAGTASCAGECAASGAGAAPGGMPEQRRASVSGAAAAAAAGPRPPPPPADARACPGSAAQGGGGSSRTTNSTDGRPCTSGGGSGHEEGGEHESPRRHAGAAGLLRAAAGRRTGCGGSSSGGGSVCTASAATAANAAASADQKARPAAAKRPGAPSVDSGAAPGAIHTGGMGWGYSDSDGGAEPGRAKRPQRAAALEAGRLVHEQQNPQRQARKAPHGGARPGLPPKPLGPLASRPGCSSLGGRTTAAGASGAGGGDDGAGAGPSASSGDADAAEGPQGQPPPPPCTRGELELAELLDVNELLRQRRQRQLQQQGPGGGEPLQPGELAVLGGV